MKRCPECGHAFRGNGWVGSTPIGVPTTSGPAWPHIQAGTYWEHKGKLLEEWLAQCTKDQGRGGVAGATPQGSRAGKAGIDRLRQSW
jgi:hypothetical protein